jgi:predicted NAD/FAD-binding protein
MPHQVPTTSPVAVIGAGPAGLAAAAALRAKGVDAVVLERADDVGSSWRRHYDRLHLHTVRWLSGLPGMAMPRSEGNWVSREGVIRYLEAYTAHHGLDVRTGVAVERVERNERGWALRSPQGDVHASAVVVATGYNHTPVMPDVPGIDDFTGELLHASRYRNGKPYAGKDVLVVGGRVIASMRRQGAPGDFRSNLHQQGTAEKVKIAGASGAVIHVENAGDAVAGNNVAFAIRPEKMRVSSKAPARDTPNVLEGEVYDIAYLGDMTIYRIRLDDGQIVKASALNAARVTEDPLTWNDRAWISFQPDAGVVLTR